MNRLSLLVFGVLCIGIVTSGVISSNNTNFSTTAAFALPHGVQADSTKWEHMNFDQRRKFMREVVMPTMKKEFVAFDSIRFHAMNCGTCHGDGVSDHSFKMPNHLIPPLPKTEDAFMSYAKDKPDITKFMSTVAVPKMAALLGMNAFNPQTKTGNFSCDNCHKLE